MKTKWILPLGLLLGMVISCSKEDPAPKPLEQEEEVEQVNKEVNLCSTVDFVVGTPYCYRVIISTSKKDYVYDHCSNNPFTKCLDVPTNEPITLTIVYKDNCLIQRELSEVFGPFPPNPQYNDIELMVDNTGDNTFHSIIGSAVNCNDALVENGLFIVKSGGKQIHKNILNGMLGYQFYNCEGGNDFTIKTIDFDTEMISETITYPLLEGVIQIPSISTCTPLHEFITYQIGGSPIITYENVDFIGKIDLNHVESYVKYEDLFYFRWGEGLGLNFGVDANGHFTGVNPDGSYNFVDTHAPTYHSIGEVGEFMIITLNATYSFYDGTPHHVPMRIVMCVKRDPW